MERSRFFCRVAVQLPSSDHIPKSKPKPGNNKHVQQSSFTEQSMPILDNHGHLMQSLECMARTVVVRTIVINCHDFQLTGFGSPARRAFFASGETNSSPFRFCLAWLIRTWWQRFASDI